MENKSSQTKTNRALYLIVVGVLVLVSLVIGLTAAFSVNDKTPKPTPDASQNGEDKPPVDNSGSTDGTEDTVPEEKPTVFSAPLSGVVSKYHDSAAPVYSITMNDWRVHQGIDVAATLGDGVKATAAGVVKSIWQDAFMGHCVSIDHGNGVVSIYKNLAEALVEGVAVGKELEAGEVFAAVGESACIESADAPHLHFEMEVDGKQVDPLSYISEESYEASLKGDTAYGS